MTDRQLAAIALIVLMLAGTLVAMLKDRQRRRRIDRYSIRISTHRRRD